VRIFTIFPIHRGVRWDQGGRWCRLVAWLSAGRRQPKPWVRARRPSAGRSAAIASTRQR
jgi:hypothetical protein